MNEDQIFIIDDDVVIVVTMPDDATESFLLERPNDSQSPFWFEIVPEAPSGSRFYKDPTRTYQKHFEDYYPIFHFNYASHRMFTTKLLVAKNIELKTPPSYLDVNDYITTDCLLQNESAVKNYFNGLPFGAYSTVSEDRANPVPSGDLELIFKGKAPLSWNEAINYYFYERMDSSNILASSDELVSNDDIIIHN